MAEIVVDHAVKRFGSFTAIDDVSLTVEDQEFVVLVGPSGCGKTTLLRAIAGLGMVDSGRIMIDNKDVTYLPPKERSISMVFQSYAIFPHMKVYDNIAFGLKMRKNPKDKIRDRVYQAAQLLHIENMLDRYPGQMSGGQRQRVAVARAIAYDAKLLLMDEPLSNLDALLRLEMRAELKALLKTLNATTVYVTHDQTEAMSMGDRIAVMYAGKILQFDSPMKIYDVPTDQFVGSFIGNPPMNFIPAQVQRHDAALVARVGDYDIKPPDNLQDVLKKYDSKSVFLGIRAENMEALVEPSDDSLKVHVEVLEPLGAHNLLTIQVNNQTLKLTTHPDFPVQMGDDIWIRFPSNKIRWIDADNGKAITPLL